MPQQNETRRAGDAAGSGECSLLGGVNTQIDSQPPAENQVAITRLEMEFEDLEFHIGDFWRHLDAAASMIHARNIPGTLFALRCCRGYWRAIAGHAKELDRLYREGGQ